MNKKISIAVSEFALPIPRRGSIDVYSGFGAGQSFGIQIHQEIQIEKSKKYPNYEAEVWTMHKFRYGKFIFEVSGIIDGIFREEKSIIEEIKTGFDLNKLYKFVKENEDHPYCLQLKTYGYFHWLRTKEIPILNLHLVSSRNKKIIDHQIVLDVKIYEDWLSKRLEELNKEALLTEKIIKKRKRMAKSFSFPFSNPRPGQIELLDSVKNGIKKNHPMLFQAPTGLGKTMGILFPSLDETMKRGQKVIYLTPKNSQQIVALDAVQHIQSNGTKIKSLILTAKKKICMKQEPICNAEYCEFAENHYTNVEENQLVEKLRRKKTLNSYIFRKTAEQYKVCPYELQMDMIPNVEIVICDYNYVFSPNSASSRVVKNRLGEEEKPNLIIDELHNLPARAMEYFSPGLSIGFFERVSTQIEVIPLELREKFLKLLQECVKIIESCAIPEKKGGPYLINPPMDIFRQHEIVLREFLTSYLESDFVIGTQDPVLNIYNYWNDFTAALEWTGRDEFFTSYFPNPPAIKITCCDASQMVKDCYNQFSKVIGFSATLKPFDFYSELIGFHSKKLTTEEFFSPFPKERRKLIIIPQVSSKYSERWRNYSRIAEAITKITALKKGNYLAFFPSFDFMEKVLRNFEPTKDFKVISQSRGMRQEEVRRVLHILSDTESSNIVFAVLGGVFAEGIDYPGDLAIGVFVVGVPLPNYDWEREKMKEYYQMQYSKGEEYAYIFPAMAKAIQAAGRVIRSEKDKGIIVLMDDRYLRPHFYQCMPKDWFESDPVEVVSQSILNDVRKFWDESH